MSDASGQDLPTLLTFQPMVDSETSRLLLAHYRVAYRESDHLFGLVSILAKARGGTGFLPLLYGPGLAITAPRPIAEHFEALEPPERRLIPTEGPLAAEVEADWQTFNGEMGADTAVFAYYHLLPERKLMTRIFATPVPWLEAKLTPLLYPVLDMLFRKGLKLSPERAEEAIARIRRTFEATDRRIADGRPYLCGDKVTLGDIALAAASAPLLLPDGYHATMPALAEMPPPVRSAMEELAAHPTADFVKRLYSEGFPRARAA